LRGRILVGTRGSPLALAQTSQVIKSLKEIARAEYQVVPIRTRGDKMQDLGNHSVENKSAFVQEIEDELSKRTIDVAVHSLKDLTTDPSPGLVIAAVPERENPRDVLISRDKTKFNELQGAARVGTSSPRRKAQILAARGDLEVLDLHGNVDTRIRKLSAGEYDAIVVAAAGLKRLGLEKHATEFLSPDIILPAVGQGALAIQCREDDEEVKSLLSKINHETTRRAVEAERAFARRLGANCRTPIAAYARAESRKLKMDGMVASLNGRMMLRSKIISDNPNPEKIGEELAESLLSKGAQLVLEAA
jgi:hydroxymethylbilane synthase